MNENELYVVQEYRFDKPLFTKIDTILDKCFRDCYNSHFHKFKYECIYDINLQRVLILK